MYFGTNNGKLYRLDDYANADATTVPKDISPSGLSGNVADIAVNPNDDNEVMIVVSNYSTIGIWWSANAKAATPSWYNVEGNLTLPSIRSCAIVVKKDASNNPVTEYYVGTSVGLYSTASISQTLGAGGTVQWFREAASIINYAVVSCMDYRPEDNTLLIGTHGNGMYYTVIGSPNYQPISSLLWRLWSTIRLLSAFIPASVPDNINIKPEHWQGSVPCRSGSLICRASLCFRRK